MLTYDFAAELSQGETLLSVTASSYLWPGLETETTATLIGTPAPQIAGSQIALWIQGGNAGECHRIALVVTTDQGQTLQGDIYIDVVEAI